MKRLVLFAEGDGDVEALPALVGRLLSQLPDNLQGQLFLDNAPMKVGSVDQLTGRRQRDLLRHLGNAAKRSKLGATLLVLDGDAERVEARRSVRSRWRVRLLTARWPLAPGHISPLPLSSFGRSMNPFCSRWPTSFPG
jgi:hypothetical protein